MAQDFYPFVENEPEGNEAPALGGTPTDAAAGVVRPPDGNSDVDVVRHPARIAVYDDAAAAPRVVMVEPKAVRPYLEEITLQVTQLAQGQGGKIPFMVIREIVENFIHAYFMQPTISILDHGNTIRFSDQGPGIGDKVRALQYGTTSATEEMRRYIRGVGSGLPYVQQYMRDKGGSLEIDDNISGGTVVTLRTAGTKAQRGPGDSSAEPTARGEASFQLAQPWQDPYAQASYQQQPYWNPPYQQAPYPQAPWPGTTQGQATYQPAPYQQPQYPSRGYPQQGGFSQMSPTQVPGYSQQGFPQQYPQPYDTSPQAPQQTSGGWNALTARGRAVVDYLSTHDSVGPSDLARAYGESQPTWTRELQALEEQGVVRKEGQKRRLTAYGRSFIER